MSEQKPPQIPIWLILIAVAIIVPRLFAFLLPIVVIFYLIGGFKNWRQWRDKFNTIRKEGIDISKFQENNTKKAKTTPNNPFSSFSFQNPMNDFQIRPKHVLSIVGILIIVFIIIDGLVSVPPGHVAVIYDRGRGVLEEELPEGLHLKIPFWQTATIMDTRLQAYTMSVATGEGELYGDDSIEALTKDGQKVEIDVTIQYRIDSQKASDIFRSVGLNYDEKIVRPEVRSVIREVITGYESKELFSLEPRQEASQKMEEKLREEYTDNDILLDSLHVRNVRFSQVYLNSIEEKQVAEQEIQKAEFEKQEAEIRKEKTIIEAQAQAESIRLKGEALANNPEVIQLEFVNKMAPQINWGILPDGALPLIDLQSLQN